MRSSNMENSNSREYLEKITAAVIDNLRQTGPAPSVQMQDVPRKPFGGMTDEEEAELDDLDEDENKDVRMSEHRWDKHVENGREFEPSDDDDHARANGATRINGNKRSFNDFKKTGKEEDTENGTPSKEANGNEEPAADDTHDINDDTIEDVTVAEQPDKDVAQEKEAGAEATKSKVDQDGDVGMADSTPAEETPIKKEDVEPEAEEADKASNDKPVRDKAAKDAEAAEPKDTTPAKDAETEAESNPEEKDSEKPAERATSEKAKEEPSADAMEVDDEKENAADSKDAASAS